MTKIEIAEQSLLSLKQIMNENTDDCIISDAVFHRFTLAVDCWWNVSREELRKNLQIDLWSPKEGIEACLEMDLITAEEALEFFQLLHDAKSTSLTYHPSIKTELLTRIPSHHNNMQNWIEKIEAQES